MKREDWALLAINSAEEVFLSPVQLQKTLFLLAKKKPSAIGKGFYKFIPYNYGPFCKDIYLDTERLATEGLLRFHKPIGQRWIGYVLTEKGKRYVQTLKNKVKKEDLNYLFLLINWIKKLSFKQLLSIIYKEYPKYRINSVFPEL